MDKPWCFSRSEPDYYNLSLFVRVFSPLCLDDGKPSIIQRQHWPAIFWPGYTAATLFKRQRAAGRSFKMISFSNVNKQYGKQLLFVDASLQLNPGEKVG